MFHRVAFDRASATSILDVFAAGGLEPCVNVVAVDESDAVIGYSPSTHADHVTFIERFTRRADVVDVVVAEDVVPFVLCGLPCEALSEVAAGVAHLAAGTVSIDHQYGGHCLSVRPLGVNKWAGVQAFCASYDLDSSAVLAVGDGENDLELLTSVAVACAIEGGSAAAINAADHVLAPADEGGWAALVDLLEVDSSVVSSPTTLM